MRTFVYSDTNILNSYISQINGGLVTKTQQEASKSTSERSSESSSTPETFNEAELSLHVAKFKLSMKDTGVTSIQDLAKYDYGKELIEKVLHDNTVQDLIDSMRERKDLKEGADDFKIGDYVLFQSQYDVLDIDFLLEFLNSSFMRKSLLLETSQPEGNRASRRSQSKKQHASAPVTPVAPDVFDVLDALCKFVPYHQIIVTPKHLIPIDPRFLRESLQSIRFKYSGEMTVLGKITSTPAYTVESSSFMNPQLSSLFNAGNSLMTQFILSNSEWITTPIALFFE